LLPLESGTGPVVRIAGRDVLLFASNDYLGLAGHPEVVAAAVHATETYGAGSGAARLVSGSLPPHQQLEQALAQFKGAASALTFGSGYLANVGAIPALVDRGGLILADRLCHASLIDGCRLSGATAITTWSTWRHCSPNDERAAGRSSSRMESSAWTAISLLYPSWQPSHTHMRRISMWTTHMALA
jgi:7-keto-8-aminopelargonate synthetase-like enzyme